MTRQSEISIKLIGNYVLQLLISTFGANVIGFISVLIPALVIAAFTHSTHGNIVDRMVTGAIFRFGADNPFFLGPIFAGLILGILPRFLDRSAGLVWPIPALILIVTAFTWNSTYTPRSHWADVWSNLFGSDCGSSECMYELLVTAPFYTSIAYSLGWYLSRTLLRRTFGSSFQR
jgi:hypothetical protein